MLPYIKNNTFYLEDKPFIMLAGELHNSSSSSLEYMEKNVWPNLRDLNMNTVLMPVAWETIEHVEGEFDFTLVKGLIEQARREQMRIVFLWFGLWKNGESMYVPKWIKKDSKKYYRVQKVNNELINTISPFCKAAVDKDQNAFARLMDFIREFDEKHQTVIMMQVENEIGVLGSDRDYCTLAAEVFEQQVPELIAGLCGRNGTWKECFQEEAEECFMSYAFASAVEKITKAGKAEYDLPCYVNAWLEQWPWEAGTYPSGGPVAKMYAIWKMTAPSLSCLAPDIYVPYVADVADEYAMEENPLMIPEVRKDAMASTYALYCVLGKGAICYSPFGIEDIALSDEEIEKPPLEVCLALNIDPTAFEMEGSKEALRSVYGFIRNIQPLYDQYKNSDKQQVFIKRGQWHYGDVLVFREFRFRMGYESYRTGSPISGGGVIELCENQFLLYGMNTRVEVLPKLHEHC